MCRSFSVHFQCTEGNPQHKLCFRQACQRNKLSRFLERTKIDAESLRGYTLYANRLCPECDPDWKPVSDPPTLTKKGDRHLLGVDDARTELQQLQGWARSL